MYRAHAFLDTLTPSSGVTTSRNPSENAQFAVPNSKSRPRSRRASLATLLGSTGLSSENRSRERRSFKTLAQSYASKALASRSGVRSMDNEAASSQPQGKHRKRFIMRDSPNSGDDDQGERIPTPLAFMKEDIKPLVISKKHALQKAEAKGSASEIILVTECTEDKKELQNLPSAISELITSSVTRSVLLSNFPTRTIDLKSVLAQVCGGPLVSIERVKEDSSNAAGNESLILSFMNIDDATKFKLFSATGMFLINGIQPRSFFTKESNNDFDVVKHLRHEMEVKGARRCLILKKNPKAAAKAIKDASNQKTHLGDLDIVTVRKDFEIFGGIVEIAAIISKRLGFCVHFYDVRSAINAKKELDKRSGSLLSSQYADWNVWYGKDPCERPCYAV